MPALSYIYEKSNFFNKYFLHFHETMPNSIPTVLGFRLYLTLKIKTELEAIVNRCH